MNNKDIYYQYGKYKDEILWWATYSVPYFKKAIEFISDVWQEFFHAGLLPASMTCRDMQFQSSSYIVFRFSKSVVPLWQKLQIVTK